MSTVAEIEVAIEKLAPSDIRRVAAWLEAYQERSETAKKAAIEATSGCLAGEEGEVFEKAVEEAGNSMMEDHAW